MAGELRHAAASASKVIAEFVATAKWEDVPCEVRHEAKRALVNLFATALAGCRDPGVLAVESVFAGFRSSDECTVIGRPGRTDMLHAASLNAMSANVFDFDDTHVPTIIHPTAPVAPALFALAQTRRISGRELLVALAVGIEVECRLGNAVSPWHYQRGWHITATCGVFGAAAACGRLLGLDAQGIRSALGNASAQSSGLVETLGTMAKSIGVGNASSNGLLSALLAGKGLSGPEQPLEGARGFLRVMGERVDVDTLRQGWGEHWELMNNTYKPYPCGVVLNPVIEACLTLHHKEGVRLVDVVEVTLTGHPLLVERTARPVPLLGRQSQVSAVHAVAVALAHGRAGLDEFSDAGVADPALGGHAFILTFVDDVSMGVEAATVTLKLRDGHQRRCHIAVARGSLDAPLADADLSRKLLNLCAWGMSGCDAAVLLDALWSLDTHEDAGAVMFLAQAAAQHCTEIPPSILKEQKA